MSTSVETRKLVLAAHAACEEKKALHARILELDPAESAFTDVFLICSGANPRQVQAIADEVELRMKREFGMYANSVEGYRAAKWILLDYVDFVVHVFDEETRALYDIERLRKTASSVALEDWKRPLVAKVAAVRAGAKAKTPARKSAAAKSATGKKSAARSQGPSRGTKKVAAQRSSAGQAKPTSKKSTTRKKATKTSGTKSAAARPARPSRTSKAAKKQTGRRKPTR